MILRPDGLTCATSEVLGRISAEYRLVKDVNNFGAMGMRGFYRDECGISIEGE